MSISAAVFERILAFLTPLFQDRDADSARETAREMLAGYGAKTNRELRFAALSIAFSLGALDALSRAVEPDLSVNQVIRLRGNAGVLNRAAEQNETRLEKLQKQSVVVDKTKDAVVDLDVAEPLPASSALADLLAFARSRVDSMKSVDTAISPAQAAETVSRQQRRDAERKAAKAVKRQQQEARLAQRTAMRLAAANQAVRQGSQPRLGSP